MLTALIYMGAVRAYQWYERHAAAKALQEATDGNAFTFQNIPVSLAAPQAEPVSSPIPYDQKQTAIFLETLPISDEMKNQQAQETIDSILDDYKDDYSLQQFNRDLSAATQGTVSSLSDLSGADLGEILQGNPQINQIVQENMQNPEFAKTVQQIFTNPQFIESIKQLQSIGVAPISAETKESKKTQ